MTRARIQRGISLIEILIVAGVLVVSGAHFWHHNNSHAAAEARYRTLVRENRICTGIPLDGYEHEYDAALIRAAKEGVRCD